MQFPEWYKEAERLYVEENLPYYKIGEKLNLCRKTISKWLRLGGHQSNSKYARTIDPSKLQKYKINENAFTVIDTEEKAYWLGFLYADGNVQDMKHIIELGLKEEDYEHLVKFKEFLETDRPIYRKEKRVNDKVYVGYRIMFSNQTLTRDLIKSGCKPNKTKILTFPSEQIVPKHLVKHFVRGYFDGDGCITFVNGGRQISVEILGTDDFLKEIIVWSKSKRDKIHGFKHSDIKRVQFFGEDAQRVLKEMYENSTVYLDRKYALYQKHVSPSDSEMNEIMSGQNR